jgi:hypothetical protein
MRLEVAIVVRHVAASVWEQERDCSWVPPGERKGAALRAVLGLAPGANLEDPVWSRRAALALGAPPPRRAACFEGGLEAQPVTRLHLQRLSDALCKGVRLGVRKPGVLVLWDTGPFEDRGHVGMRIESTVTASAIATEQMGAVGG